MFYELRVNDGDEIIVSCPFLSLFTVNANQRGSQKVIICVQVGSTTTRYLYSDISLLMAEVHGIQARSQRGDKGELKPPPIE